MSHANTSRAATIEAIIAIMNGHTDCGCAHDRADAPRLRDAAGLLDAENTRLRRRDYETRVRVTNFVAACERVARGWRGAAHSVSKEFADHLDSVARDARAIADVK